MMRTSICGQSRSWAKVSIKCLNESLKSLERFDFVDDGTWCELCEIYLPIAVTYHMRMVHPGCGKSAKGTVLPNQSFQFFIATTRNLTDINIYLQEKVSIPSAHFVKDGREIVVKAEKGRRVGT